MHVPRGPRLGTQVRINRLLWFEMPWCCSSVLLVPKTWGSDAHQQWLTRAHQGSPQGPADLAQPLGIPSGRHWKWALALLPGPPIPSSRPKLAPNGPPKETQRPNKARLETSCNNRLGRPEDRARPGLAAGCHPRRFLCVLVVLTSTSPSHVASPSWSPRPALGALKPRCASAWGWPCVAGPESHKP